MKTILDRIRPEERECINNCLECHAVCEETAAYCLEIGNTQPKHIRLLLDCAEICQTSANYMLRGSELHNRICSACAEICERCYQECNRQSNDSKMQYCAEVCRRCADSCKQMGAMAMA
jgi:hypothetical protein